ncbi:MAG: ATP-binding protein [Acidobacteria bacterium]|nr:ATP-binding protein [Acidobacteriota bacterium]
MNGFVNRNEELALLDRLMASNHRELLVIYGRRRLGKTALLRHFGRGQPLAYFACPLTTAAEALRLFTRELARAFDDPLLARTTFSGWTEAVEYALERCGRKRTPLVLDELPYLQRSVPGIDSLLQHAWDGHDDAVKLLLAGSSFSVMDAAVANPRAPLYGRRTAQLEVQPMSFRDVGGFYLDWSFEQRAVAYGLFGGVPAYAEQAARHESPAEAAHALALSPAGPLYAEPDFLVREELRDPGAYFAILHSLASGKTRPNEIAQDAGIPHASVGKYLDVLRRLRLVRRETPVTEPRPERSRRSLYRLDDSLLRFWFRYVYPNRSALEAGGSRDVLGTVVLPDLDTFMGQPYEDICRQHLIDDGERLLGWQPLRVGRYWDARTEIDLIAVDASGERAAFVECKWGRSVDVARLVRRLREKARAVAPYAAASHRYLVISRTDMSDEHHVRLA